MSYITEVEEILSGRRQPLKGPFYYKGNKEASVSKIIPYIPDKKVYVEVFGGTGVILLNKPRSSMEVFNDRNSGITDFYICLQSQIDELTERCRVAPHSRELYHWAREKLKEGNEKDRMIRAVCWFILAQQSFLANAGRSWKRQMTPPPIASTYMQKLAWFKPIQLRIEHVTIENLHWVKCLDDYDSKDTVFYCDPPYLETEAYDGYPVKHEDLLRQVFDCEGTVLVSGYDHPLYAKQKWSKVVSWEVPGIQSKNAFSGPAKEFLYIKR